MPRPSSANIFAQRKYEKVVNFGQRIFSSDLFVRELLFDVMASATATHRSLKLQAWKMQAKNTPRLPRLILLRVFKVFIVFRIVRSVNKTKNVILDALERSRRAGTDDSLLFLPQFKNPCLGLLTTISSGLRILLSKAKGLSWAGTTGKQILKRKILWVKFYLRIFKLKFYFCFQLRSQGHGNFFGEKKEI